MTLGEFRRRTAHLSDDCVIVTHNRYSIDPVRPGDVRLCTMVKHGYRNTYTGCKPTDPGATTVIMCDCQVHEWDDKPIGGLKDG